MWSLIKVASVIAALISALLMLFSLSKLVSADEKAKQTSATAAAELKEAIGKNVSVEVDVKAEPVTNALEMFLLSGAVLVASVVAFVYATVKGRKKPGYG